MPIFVDVSINDTRLGKLKISRRGKRRPGKEVYTYGYIFTNGDGAQEGEVEHRYDDGAWKLIQLCVKDAGI